MRIVSADSASAILDEKFEPKLLVACGAVLVEEPYRRAIVQVVEPLFLEVDDSRDVIVGEAQMCLRLLEEVEADVVHLDMTFGGLSVEALSPVELFNLKPSLRARQSLLKILPKLRKVAGEIRRKHDIDTIAIGKESVPVRIAELTTASQAILYACASAVEKKAPLLLGLPTRCTHQINKDKVVLNSLIPAEHDIQGYAKDPEQILNKVTIEEFPNPVARGFRALKITPI